MSARRLMTLLVLVLVAESACATSGGEPTSSTVGASSSPCDALDCGPWLCVHNGVEATCMDPDEDLVGPPPRDDASPAPTPEPGPAPQPGPGPGPDPLPTPNPDLPPAYDANAEVPCDVASVQCAAAVQSVRHLPSANGFGAIVFDRVAGKVNGFYEHLYRNWDEGVWTRNLAYDTYFGLRVGSERVWLDTVAAREVRYLDDAGIIWARYAVLGLEVEVYFFAPWQLRRPALLMAARVVNPSATPVRVDVYSLHNYHLGYTSSAEPVRPDARGERLLYDEASAAYVETGVGGTLVHWPLGGATHHGATPGNPWQRLNAGLDLGDEADSGMGDDRVAGFQQRLELAPSAEGWLGVVTAFDPGSSAAPLLEEVRDAYADHTPASALHEARAEWEGWRKAPPAHLTHSERRVYRQSEAVLRMAQIHETTDRSHGQLVASLPPGSWNITWIRDMAYAITALTRMGHHAEARAALAFVLAADSGRYEVPYVGAPYQVSITRYFGRGREETDVDANGPNIEFDGFGLFLWALGEYVQASGDGSLVEGELGDVVRARVGDALISLIEPTTGLVRADSSIWEVHWNGRERRHAYTSLTAARGLCELAALDHEAGRTADAARYKTAGAALVAAIERELVTTGGLLAASREARDDAAGALDLAVADAWALGVLEPRTTVAMTTLDTLMRELRVPHGHGFMRNDDGGWYDSREWVFVDLRLGVALAANDRPTESEALLDWVTAQGHANAGLLAELHDPLTRAYDGAAPMVGFGAGAYVLALHERARPITSTARSPAVSFCLEEQP